MSKHKETASLEKWWNKVYFQSSENMSQIPDQSVHLVFTSPPYFNIKDYSLDGDQQASHSERDPSQIGDIPDFDDYINGLLVVWKECWRVLKPGGKLAINTPLMPMPKDTYSTHDYRHIFDINASIQNSILEGIEGMFLYDCYIWNRVASSRALLFGSYPYPPNFLSQNTSEFITIYVKEGKVEMPPKEIKERSALTQEEWVNWTKQVWDIPPPSKSDIGYKAHSAIMPEEIARRVVRLFSFVEDVVLDPFAGSGTTLKAAKELDRKHVGYEIMEAYSSVIQAKTAQNLWDSIGETLYEK